MSGWQPTRVPRGVAAGPDAEALRDAYLELLKLCLCDLGGTGTISVWKHTDGSLMSRELTGDDLKIRAAGVDWPLHGVTMVGLERLDDLQACVEAVVRDGVAGDVIEAGTWRGGAAILMRATLDALGTADRTVWVADSFQGFPLPDGERPDPERLAEIDYLAVPQEQVEANFARLGYGRGVRFLPGFFQETLPGLTGERWALVRLDGDSYEATWTALAALYPRLTPGGFVVVDDYGALEECRQAVDEFRAQNGIDEPLEEIDWTGVRWRRTSAEPVTPQPPASVAASGPLTARERPGEPARIVSLHERELMRDKRHLHRDLEALRQRLAAAEADIAALHGTRHWLRRKLGRLRRRG